MFAWGPKKDTLSFSFFTSRKIHSLKKFSGTILLCFNNRTGVFCSGSGLFFVKRRKFFINCIQNFSFHKKIISSKKFSRQLYKLLINLRGFFVTGFSCRRPKLFAESPKITKKGFQTKNFFFSFRCSSRQSKYSSTNPATPPLKTLNHQNSHDFSLRFRSCSHFVSSLRQVFVLKKFLGRYKRVLTILPSFFSARVRWVFDQGENKNAEKTTRNKNIFHPNVPRTIESSYAALIRLTIHFQH